MLKVAPSKEQRLNVQFRVEPGCLGPNGDQHIEHFCEYAEEKFETLDSEVVAWKIIPRLDKSLPEVEYRVMGKKLLESQVDKYLEVCGVTLEELETHLHDKLVEVIIEYMN